MTVDAGDGAAICCQWEKGPTGGMLRGCRMAKHGPGDRIGTVRKGWLVVPGAATIAGAGVAVVAVGELLFLCPVQVGLWSLGAAAAAGGGFIKTNTSMCIRIHMVIVVLFLKKYIVIQYLYTVRLDKYVISFCCRTFV